MPVGGFDEAGDHPQRRRLAAAGRTKQRHELALSKRQVDIGHGRHGPKLLPRPIKASLLIGVPAAA
jgi:hypothetical protein